MATINNTPNVPTYVPLTSTGTNQTGGVDQTPLTSTGTSGVEQGSLSPTGPAGEIAYDSASVNGTAWGVINNDLAIVDDTHVDITAIMVLMIEANSEMRQDQRQVALADAQNALQSGLNAADAMKKAAIASAISSGVSGLVTIGASAYSIGAINSAAKAGGLSDTELTKIQAWGRIGTTAGEMAGAGGNLISGMYQAQSKAYEAQAQYEQSIQQSDQSFFQQLGDSIRALQQTLQTTESATHQAYHAIYGA